MTCAGIIYFDYKIELTEQDIICAGCEYSSGLNQGENKDNLRPCGSELCLKELEGICMGENF